MLFSPTKLILSNFSHFVIFLSRIQSHQGELDLLNERAREILRQADPVNRSRIEQQNTDINKNWSDLLNNLENRREALATLAQHWEDFDHKYLTFESQLTRLDERSRHVDPVVRSRRQLEDTKNVIQVIISACVLISKRKRCDK